MPIKKSVRLKPLRFGWIYWSDGKVYYVKDAVIPNHIGRQRSFH